MAQNLSVYKASAGAGKTFILTAEYILLLLREGADEWRHTLAVTFTNKATAEMKSRILETLYGISRGLPESDAYVEAITESLRKTGEEMGRNMMAKRAGEALVSILHDYSYFRVETIDSFFQSVLRNMAYELGLNASLTVELNSGEVVSRAVDRMVEKMHLDAELQRWIMDFVKEQVDNGNRWDITGNVKKFAECIYREEYMKRTPQENALLADSDNVRNFKAKMHAVKNSAKARLAKAAAEMKALMESELDGGNKVSFYNRYTSALAKMGNAEQEDKPSATLMKAIDNPLEILKTKDRQNASLAAAAQTVSESLAQFYRLYREEMARTNTADLCLDNLNSMRLLEAIEHEANEINAENNQFILSRTPVLLSRLKGDTDAPFVFEKTGVALHNVMIDEFQDTSQLQWDNFKELLFENQATGGSDLLVGDIKQSIYRWRNGKWEILAGVKEELSRLHPQEKQLTYNYRSERTVVDFNNMFFPLAAQCLDDTVPTDDEGHPPSPYSISDIYADVRQSSPKKHSGGYVSVSLREKDTDYREDTCRQLTDRIHSLLGKGLRQKDIAILVRNNADAKELTAYFSTHAKDIRPVSDEAFTLEASVAVQMVIAALRCMVDSEGKDPIPSKYLALHYMTDVMRVPAGMDSVCGEPPAKLREAFFNQIPHLASLPLYILCERLHHILGLSRIEGQDAYIFTFFDNLQNCLRNGTSDIHSFLQAWDGEICRKAIPPAGTDGIRVMTIHKAKGLQFHTVLLPFLDWEIERTLNETVWHTPVGQPFCELGALPMKLIKKMEKSTMKDVYLKEMFQKRVDALNLLYVAFTRAECNLMIWGDTSRKNSVSTAGDLIRAVLGNRMTDDGGRLCFKTGKVVTASAAGKTKSANRMKTENTEAEALEAKMVSSEPRLDFRQSNLSRRYLADLSGTDKAQRQAYVEIGIAMHHVLSKIRHSGELDKALAQSVQEGLVADNSTMRDIAARLRKGFKNETVRRWFAPECEVFNECGIVCPGTDGNASSSFRPDRVVIHGSVAEVVDYKFGTPREEHIQQVRVYMSLLRQLYPRHTVKGFLWYMYSGTIKEVTA